MAVDYDLCEECHKDFKSFMFGPERDLDSKTTLKPWSEVGDPPNINGCKLKSCNFSNLTNGVKEETDSGDCTDADAGLSKAKYKIGSYIIQSDIIKGSIYKIVDIRLRDDDEIVYKIENLSSGIQNLLWERVIDNYYTVIVKYSCEGCKLEGTDDCSMCDTCIVGDPKGPRRQWWKPKEEG